MDMVVANLLKRKVHFRLISHDPDPQWPYFPGKGYHYVSDKIEDGKSIGFKSTHDLFDLNKSLFSYILSTIKYEIKELETIYYPISYEVTIKIHLIREEDHKDYIIYTIRFEDNFSLIDGEITWHSNHPKNLVDDKFSIYVESYVYY